MVYRVPLELIIEAERQQRQQEEERRIHLELPVPERRPGYQDPSKDRSGVEIIDLYDESDEEPDRGVTIINILGDD